MEIGFFFISLIFYLFVNIKILKSHFIINTHTLFFYCFIVYHVFGILYIALFNPDIVYDFFIWDKSVIKTGLITYGLFMIFYSIGAIVGIFPLNGSNKWYQNVSSFNYKENNLEKILIFLTISVFIFNFILFLIKTPVIPLFEALKNIGNKKIIYLYRHEISPSKFKYYRYFMTNLRFTSRFLLTYYTIRHLLSPTFRNKILLILILFLVGFFNLSTFHRGPILWMLVYFLLIRYTFSNKMQVKLNPKFLAKLLLVILIIFIPIQWIIIKGNLQTILRIFIIRVGLGQVLTLLTYFQVYPEYYGKIGLSFSNFLSKIFNLQPHFPAQEIYYIVGKSNFDRPIIFNTIGIGDFFAANGILGVIVGSFLTGLIVQIVDNIIKLLPVSIFSIVTLYCCCFMFKALIGTNILVCLNSQGIIWTLSVFFAYTFLYNTLVLRKMKKNEENNLCK